MPPKKSKKKTKSKRYSCELCYEIDNAMMIQCDGCLLRYHLKCLGIDSIHVDDVWKCLACEEDEKSQVNDNKKQKSASMPQAHGPKQTENSTKAKRTEAVDTENQSQQPTTKSTGSRRAQIELERIEEERILKEKRDKEYLDSKYKFLLDNCSEKSNESIGCKRNTDRSMYTQRWVRQQEIGSKSANVSQFPMPIKRKEGRTNPEEPQQFAKTIDNFEFDKTSPPDQKLQSTSSKVPHVPLMMCDKVQPNVIHMENERQICSAMSRGNENTYNGDRIPCPEHDAKLHLFRGRTSKNFENGEPNSNSTFVVPQNEPTLQYQISSTARQMDDRMDLETRENFARRFKEATYRPVQIDQTDGGHVGCPIMSSTSARNVHNNEATSIQSREERTHMISPEVTDTLEWDNFVGSHNDQENSRQSLVMSRLKSYFDEHVKPKPNLRYEESRGPQLECHRPSSVNPTYIDDDVDERSCVEISSFRKFNNNQSERKVEFKEPADNFHDRTNFANSSSQTDQRKADSFQSPNGNAEIQPYFPNVNRRSGHEVGFQVPKDDNGNHSRNDNCQPSKTSYPAIQRTGNITANQIASRHVVKEKLPIFSGDPSEWLLWHHQYQSESDLCGYSNGENLNRLKKSLQGKAKTAVEGFLIHPEAVPYIMQMLQRLFGRPELIIKSIIKKIKDRQTIKADNLEDLMSFAFEVTTITTTIELLNCPSYLADPMLIEELISKLPIQERKDWAHYGVRKQDVTLKTLSVWLFELAMILSTVATPSTKAPNDRKVEKGRFEKNEKVAGLELMNVHVEQKDNSRKQKRQDGIKGPCPVCNYECNKIENCSKFKLFDVDARWKAVIDNKLCRKCLKKHKNPCFSTNVCGKNGCQFKHHFLLHNDERHSPNKYNSIVSGTRNTALSNFHGVVHTSTMLRIVPVVLYKGNKSVATFAFLDEGTTVTMMEKRLANILGLKGTSEQICLIWTKKIHRREQAERVSLEISGIEGFDKRYELKGVRTVDNLSLPTQSIDKDKLIAKYPYLSNVPFISYNNAIPGIMIGSDMPKFGMQLQVVESDEVETIGFSGPAATRTRLGWSVHGPRESSTVNEHVNIHQLEICPHHNELDNQIHQRVKEFFSVENFGVQANCKINSNSKDEERALEMLDRLTRKTNGRYETGLLWRSNKIDLPDSYPMALKRLVSLERHGPKMIRAIGAKVADYVAKGYARKLTPPELGYVGPVWYLPVFGVIHPKKPEKIRMVFDAAAKVKTISLNSVLLKGPDLYTSLIDILRRFRERLITGGGDIAEMFHQVRVIEKDRPFQRFLFREDKSKNPDVYQMDVLTFGASCSPCSAQFAKNKNAEEFIETHPRAVSAIIDNTYVDDLMECEHSEGEMIQLISDVTMINAKGGFKIRNFISNSAKVLKAIGENDSNNVKDISPKTELKVERVLGMLYNTKGDNFTFSLKYTLIDGKILNGSKLPTKRELLRTLMSIFDPLGLLSNFLIYLKILIQEVWKSQLDWDTPISSEHLTERWKRWLLILPEVENVKAPRLYSPRMSPKLPKSIQMHVFVDASEDAFAAVVYLRIENNYGVDVAFAGSKARAAPVKYLSIPRKELQGSILGTRLSTSIKDAQRFKIDKRIMWTDSATVISWLNSENRKYSQFVAHRVGEILEGSDVNEWRWVPTDENVADEATKWTKTPNFDPSNRWFSGPEFLRQSEDKWPAKKPIKIDIEEEMKANFLHSSLVLPKIIDPDRFSRYNRMVRSLAYVIRFINLLTGKVEKGEPLQKQELLRAENLIFRQAQFEGYPTEMATLVRNEVLPIDQRKFIERPSPLYDGTPYLDADDVLRMKGRIDGARELSVDTKRPIVLPKSSRITQLLLTEYHSRFFHQNHETVVNEVRQKFYIPHLREVLKKARKGCQSCKVKKSHPVPPQMADLPQARLATRFIPFSFVGVDFFGPMYVSIGRRREKRWGVLFTCLTIRAVHIEIAPGLDTNSCILCIQNFVADRGPAIEFHSDCGTNFKGSDHELQEEIKKIDPEKLHTEFTSTYTKWIFNAPASPHMGGSWERLIRSVKSSIKEIMPTRTPKEDMLRNLLKQIQNVINSRPLTYIPLDVDEDEALTPNHFLRLSSNGLKPPCKIELDGTYLRKSWKESQRLTELFWKRFVREFLPTITRRTKWHRKVALLKEGDLVLVVDENNPRNTYPKARVLRTVLGSNNQVRRAEVELISGTKTNLNGQICAVKKGKLWRPAHKLALLDVAYDGRLAEPELDRETGGSVGATGFKSNSSAQSNPTDQVDATGSQHHQ